MHVSELRRLEVLLHDTVCYSFTAPRDPARPSLVDPLVNRLLALLAKTAIRMELLYMRAHLSERDILTAQRAAVRDTRAGRVVVSEVCPHSWGRAVRALYHREFALVCVLLEIRETDYLAASQALKWALYQYLVECLDKVIRKVYHLPIARVVYLTNLVRRDLARGAHDTAAQAHRR